MKLNGFVGKGSGKLGSSVFAISGGEQIVRQYNPQVSNPQTDAQVKQRAKFKLLSQIAADLANVLAFAKDKLKSARNQFVSKNMPLVSYEDGEASVPVYNLQISAGSKEIPNLEAQRAANNKVNLNLASSAKDDCDAIVYVVIERTADNRLHVTETKVVTEPDDGSFPTSADAPEGIFDVLAYGVKFTSATAKTKFDDYMVQLNDENAILTINPASLLSGGITTATAGVEVESAGD